jgi:hypothetical protein
VDPATAALTVKLTQTCPALTASIFRINAMRLAMPWEQGHPRLLGQPRPFQGHEGPVRYRIYLYIVSVRPPEQLSKRIVLMDGDQLTRLMIFHGVGCGIEETLHVKKVDEEVFE